MICRDTRRVSAPPRRRTAGAAGTEAGGCPADLEGYHVERAERKRALDRRLVPRRDAHQAQLREYITTLSCGPAPRVAAPPSAPSHAHAGPHPPRGDRLQSAQAGDAAAAVCRRVLEGGPPAVKAGCGRWGAPTMVVSREDRWSTAKSVLRGGGGGGGGGHGRMVQGMSG